MKKISMLEKQIYRDVAASMLFPLIIYTISDILAGVISVFTAERLGGFADAVFLGNISVGLRQMIDIVVCILLSVLLVPGTNLAASLIMLNKACAHERMVMGKFLNKTYQAAMKIEEGEAQNRLENDANDLRKYWVMLWENFFGVLILFPYVFYHSVKIHTGFTMIVILISIIKLIVPLAVNKLEAKYDKATREYKAKFRSQEMEITSKPHTIKLLGLTLPMIEKMDRMYQNFYDTIFKKSVACTTIADQISAFADTFCILLILFTGAIMVSEGIITAGAVAAMIGYFSVYNTIIENISFIIRRYRILDINVQLLKIMYEDYEELSGEQVSTFQEITAESLCFSYEEKPIFTNVDFQIRAGEKTAICGTNGSGKSTLLKLISGLTKGYEGKLKLNGWELNNIAPDSWRQQFAYVTQDPYLFRISVRENVRLGNLKASDEEVEAVLQKTGIRHLAERVVSMEQNDLSGGEKQKISIARALLKNTSVLFMDEPSNNLDVDTVEWLKNFIRQSEKTILYVSHDEELSSLADQRICL